MFWGDKDTKLKPCDLAQCEAVCCTNGSALLKEEAVMIRKLVREFPEHFPNLPKHFIVKFTFKDYVGRRTAVRPYRYRHKPDHFENTRCVFAESDGKCGFQTLAVAQGKHKWAYKPFSCWMFPLSVDGDRRIIPPPRRPKDDRDYEGPLYPGFTSQTQCGMHTSDGKVWQTALEEEIQCFHNRKESES